MKYSIIAAFILVLVSCSSQKKLEVGDIPFELTRATIQEWSGGREESGSGAELKLYVSNAATDVTFENVYFRERLLACTSKTEDGLLVLTASYTINATSNTTENDDVIGMKKAFDLMPNEVIISFKEGNSKSKYSKTGEVKQMEPVMYKGRPKN